MATYIPGKNPSDRPRANAGEMIAIVGTVLCAGLSAAILIFRLIQSQ